jgi:methyltransferase
MVTALTTFPGAYVAFVALVALERLAELVVSRRNAAWSFARGGVEHGQAHWPHMVVLHTALLVACVVEPLLARGAFHPAIGWPLVAVALATQALRWWCITTLGPRWNTRVIVVPGLPRIVGGPYRYFAHPNYVAVVIEGIALPGIGGAWWTAAIFTALNALLLRERLRVEEAALATLTEGRP